jgi:hypothetical protein
MNAANAIRGRCLCGRVEFLLTPPTDFVAHCHCRSCQLAHGAAFTTWTSVPKERFRYVAGEDDIGWYRSSHWIEWGFCRRCGSSMLYRAVRSGHHESPRVGAIYVAVANLVDPVDRPPQVHVSFEERVSWMNFDDHLPKHRGKTEERIDT